MSTYEANRYAFPASAITSGTFANARLSSGSVTQHVDLSNLNASNLTSGTVPDARVGSSSVNQHVDLSNLNASNLTSGTVPNARFGTPTFSAANLTNIPAAGSTIGTWTPQFRYGSTNVSSSRSFAGYSKNGKWVGVHGMMFMNGSGGSSGNYTRVYINNLPFTSANIQKHSGFAGHCSSYTYTGHCTVKPNSTQMLLFQNVSSTGRNANPPIFTNSPTEGAYFHRSQLRTIEQASFGAKYFYFECFYLSA